MKNRKNEFVGLVTLLCVRAKCYAQKFEGAAVGAFFNGNYNRPVTLVLLRKTESEVNRTSGLRRTY